MDGRSSAADTTADNYKSLVLEEDDVKSRTMSLDEAREKAASRLSVSSGEGL